MLRQVDYSEKNSHLLITVLIYILVNNGCVINEKQNYENIVFWEYIISILIYQH